VKDWTFSDGNLGVLRYRLEWSILGESHTIQPCQFVARIRFAAREGAFIQEANFLRATVRPTVLLGPERQLAVA